MAPTIRVDRIIPGKDCLRDLAEYKMPGYQNRITALPEVYLWTGKGIYPQRQQSPTHVPEEIGNTYVVIIDTSLTGKKRAKKVAQSLTLPLGRTDDVAENHGMFLVSTRFALSLTAHRVA